VGVVGGRVDHRFRGAAEVLECDEANVEVGDAGEQHVAARARRVLRANDDVARQMADMRQDLKLAVGIACALVIEAERRHQRNRGAGDSLYGRGLRLALGTANVVGIPIWSWRVIGADEWPRSRGG